MTRLLYLEDESSLSSDATVIECTVEGTFLATVLDQTPMFVKRGGQPSDVGRIERENLSLEIEDVRFDSAGKVIHWGRPSSRLPMPGDSVQVYVDEAARKLHSLWHSAGEAIIVAAKMADFDKPVVGAIHYGPNQNRIEYESKLD